MSVHLHSKKLGPESLKNTAVEKHENFLLGHKYTSLLNKLVLRVFGRLGTSFSAKIIIQNGASMAETLVNF